MSEVKEGIFAQSNEWQDHQPVTEESTGYYCSRHEGNCKFKRCQCYSPRGCEGCGLVGQN